jgi:hypothetical protein
MSINTVHIVPAEEQYSPPEQIIELAVVGDGTDELVHEDTPEGKQFYNLKYARKLVLLSLSDYEETSEGAISKRKIEFPAIDLNDLLRALSSFGVGVQSFHVGDPPVRFPARPEDAAVSPEGKA